MCFQKSLYIGGHTTYVMTELPDHFVDEVRRAAMRIESRHRHLILLENEGLYLLDRWRNERAYWRYLQSKDL